MASKPFVPTRLQQYGAKADPRAYQLPAQAAQQSQQTYQQYYSNQSTQNTLNNYTPQNSSSNGQWQGQQYQSSHQGQTNGYHDYNSNYLQSAPNDRSYQYDQRYRTNGDGRSVQPQMPKSPVPRSQDVQRPVERQRPAQTTVDNKQKSRDRMLMRPSSPQTLAWDNPFGSFPPKKKDEDTRSNPDKGTKKNDGSFSPRPLDRPHTSHGHRGDQTSRPSTSQGRRPENSSRPATSQGNQPELAPRPSTSHSHRADYSSQPPVPQTYRTEQSPSPRMQDRAMLTRNPQPAATSTRVEIRPQPSQVTAVADRIALTQRSVTQPEPIVGYNDSRAQPQIPREARAVEQQIQYPRDTRQRPTQAPAPTAPMVSTDRRPSEPTKIPIRSQPTINEKFDANSYRGIPLTKRRSNQSADMPNFDAISAPTNERSDNLFPITQKPQSPRPQEQPAYAKQTYQALGPDRKPIRPAAINSSSYHSKDDSPASTHPTSPVGDYANPPVSAPARHDYQTNNPAARPSITTVTNNRDPGFDPHNLGYPRSQQASNANPSGPQSPSSDYSDQTYRDQRSIRSNKLTSPVPQSPVPHNDYNYRGPNLAQTRSLPSAVPQSPVPAHDDQSRRYPALAQSAQPLTSTNNRNAGYGIHDQVLPQAAPKSVQVHDAVHNRYPQHEDPNQYDPRSTATRNQSEPIVQRQKSDYGRQPQYDRNQDQMTGQTNMSRSPTSGSQFPPRTVSRPGSRPSPAQKPVSEPRQMPETSRQDSSRPAIGHDQNHIPQTQNYNQANGYGQARPRYDYDQVYSEDQYDRKQYVPTTYSSGDESKRRQPYQQGYDQDQDSRYAQTGFTDHSGNGQWTSTSQSGQGHQNRSQEDPSKTSTARTAPQRPEYQSAQSAPIQPSYVENSAQLEATTRLSDPPIREAEVPQFVQDDGQHGAVTIDELNKFREEFKKNPNDYPLGLKFAKRLVEAATVLASENGRADAKQTAKNRERYVLDAHKIVKKLVAANFAEAMFYLADCHGQGLLGLAQDPKEAFSLYQSAAKLSHPQSAYRVAVCCELGYEEGGGTRRDPQKAIQWYKRAATLGDTPAMYKMGIILLKGLLGQPRNPREAVSWLKRAAERAEPDNPHALHELALLYESAAPTDHIVRDERYALQLFTQAAELGYKYSQFRLGSAYEYGLLGCPIDPRQSITWYSRAAAQGEHQSELALSGWYLTGSAPLLQQSDTEAYLWARKAASSGLAKAEYAMGYFTEVGIGTPINHEEAKRWYYRAAAQNYPKAKERLEDLKRGGQKMTKTRHSRSNVGKHNEGDCVVM